MSDGRELQIFRDGRRRVPPMQRIQLGTGGQANLTTLGYAAEIVREDAVLPDVRSFIFREILRIDPNSDVETIISAAYEFCRDRIVYRDEGEGTETLADLWSCCYGIDPTQPVGDCAIKSTALATIIASATQLTIKPFFVAIRQLRDADYFNHVYVGILRPDGSKEALDPTPPEFVAGDELSAYQRLEYHIFQ